MTGEENTYFGKRKVSALEKTQLVTDVFRRVASSYDLMNDLMSFGIHRLWKQELVQMLRPRSHVHMLDMAGGTGDIALRFLEAARNLRASNVHVTVCDRNPAMVQEGRDKAIDQGVIHELEWTVGDASCLPFAADRFDIYTIAFGLRNVTNPQKALEEAYRVLKPGGMFFCLEFSQVDHPLLHKLYKFHSFSVIPRLGQWVARDKAAYEYLVESIARFPSPDVLMEMISKARFGEISCHRMSFGVVALHIGTKPLTGKNKGDLANA